MFEFYVHAFKCDYFQYEWAVIKIFVGMGKSFRVCRYFFFIYLKIISNISAPEVSIIQFYLENNN